jgi:gluconokinase
MSSRLPSPPMVVALDIGSSSVRVMAFDGNLKTVRGSKTQIPYSPRREEDGTAEVDAEFLIDLVTRALDRTMSWLGPHTEIAAVGASTFWHGLLGLNARGRPTTPVFLWSDTRSWRQAKALRERLDSEAVRRRTGAPIHPTYWPAKLAWLRETQPPVFARTQRWVSIGDLLYERYLGQRGTSPSIASGTGLRQLGGGWDVELLERLRVSPQSLPVETGQMESPVKAYASRWPQLARAVWVTPAGDGALANLGSGCMAPSSRAMTVGTSGALRSVTARVPERLAPGLWCYLLDERRYLVGGALSNGGNLWAWVLQTLRLGTRRLEGRLASIPAASGPDFLPLLNGERSPGFALRATGVLSGLTQATGPEEIARAALEGTALQFAVIDRQLDATLQRADELWGSGAALHASPLWAQIMADAIGKPIRVSRDFEASSAGAARLAMERLGHEVRPAPRAGRTFEVNPAAHVAYVEAGRRQTRLYELLIAGS